VQALPVVAGIAHPRAPLPAALRPLVALHHVDRALDAEFDRTGAAAEPLRCVPRRCRRPPDE